MRNDNCWWCSDSKCYGCDFYDGYTCSIDLEEEEEIAGVEPGTYTDDGNYCAFRESDEDGGYEAYAQSGWDRYDNKYNRF